MVLQHIPTKPTLLNQGTIRAAVKKPLLWAAYLVFLLIGGYTIAHHELWADELHSWNIAKGSNGFWDLINNRRYEGHPPGWYFICWVISKFTHQLMYMQLVHFVIAALAVFLVLFCSPFRLITRLLIPFGYYFLYEYAVLSRNYAIVVVLTFCICAIMRKEFPYKGLLYYLLLFLLSNTHILGIILAGSLHLYFLLFSHEQGKKNSYILLHILPGGLIFLPAMYFAFPPGEGVLHLGYFIDRWNVKNIIISIQAPLRAFIPIAAWWQDQWWNNQFILEIQREQRVLKYFTPFLSLALACLAGFILKGNRKCLILFSVNLILTLVFSSLLFPLITLRYAGIIYICFIAAWWLYCEEKEPGRTGTWLVNGLLVIHLVAGAIAVTKDIRRPFSRLSHVNEFLKEVPAHERVVTDYWGLNAVSAYAGRSLYCIDLQKEVSFILWGADFVVMNDIPNRYYTGVRNLFQREGIRQLYMISSGSPEALFRTDPKLRDSLQIQMIDKREGAIEKGSNLYLYRIHSL